VLSEIVTTPVLPLDRPVRVANIRPPLTLVLPRRFQRFVAWFAEPVPTPPLTWGHSGGWGGVHLPPGPLG
jgi:hypothetical protein